MQVGCYSLHLYCENYSVADGIHNYGEFPHEYAHEYGSRCRADARRDGWLLKRDGRALCPKCNPKRRAAKPSPSPAPAGREG